jgi:hypothetical protein
MPNHYAGDLLHTMAISEVSRGEDPVVKKMLSLADEQLKKLKARSHVRS